MTIAQIIALIRDTLIVGALGFLVYRIYSDGENRVKLEDLQAVQTQLTHNTQTLAQWHQEASNATIQRSLDMAQVTAAIAAHSGSPVILCATKAGTSAVSSPAIPSASQPAEPRTTDAGSRGRDIRAALAAFETRYESTLADCRQLQQSWPH